MESLYRIALAALPAMIAPIYATPLFAQSGAEANAWAAECRRQGGRVVITSSNPYCDMSGASGAAPNLPFGLQPGWLGNIFRGDGGAGRRSRASEINSQGIAASRAGDFDQAVTHYRQALRLNEQSPVIRLNLMGALLDSAGQFFRAMARGDTAALDRIERLLDEIDRLDRSSLDGQDGIGQIRQYVASGRRAIATARQDMAQSAANASQLANASERIADIANDINRSLGRDPPRSPTGGLGFGDPGQARPAPPTPAAASQAGTGVVADRDRQPPLPSLPRLEQVENSPGREAWLRGMDAAARANAGNPREWDLALALFQTALQRDPTNPALRQAVILAEFTRDAARRRTALPPEVRRLMTPDDSDLAFLFPGETPLPVEPTTEELARRDAANHLGTTLPEDIELLFTDTSQSRNNMVGGLDANVRARLAERGQGISAGDWTARLAPEIRGMVAELREALPPRTQGPQRSGASTSGQIATDSELIANAWASDAVVRILYGDLAGAERALDDAATLRGGLAPATELVRRWRGEQAGVLTGLAPGAQIQPDRRRE